MGPASGLTLSAGGLSRVFQIDANVSASISGLTITGGGVLNQSAATLTLNNCTFTSNTASSGGGLQNVGSVTLTNCTLSGNTATSDGGGFSNDGQAVLSSCTLTGNTAPVGGALVSNGTTTLINCSIMGNTATQAGAGLCVNGTTILTGSTLSGNTTSGYGGGLLNNSKSSTVKLTNCTITGNTADGGGGVYNNGAATLVNCTVSANSGGAKGGGGVLNAGSSATLTDTIVAGNTNGSSFASDIGGGNPVSGIFNLIGTGGSGGLTNGVSGNIVGVVNAGMASLAFYGGPTQTMALKPKSPAIGKGTVVSGVTTDQRGFRLDSPVDIGAFQVQSSPLVVNTPLEGSRVPIGALDLAAAVGLANLTQQAETITFDPKVFAQAQTITLASGEIALGNVFGKETITGPAARVTISAGGKSRVFEIDAGVTASLSGLTISGGLANKGGGVLSTGTATLTNCTVTGNESDTNGGGLVSYGPLTLIGCTVTSNSANMGAGLFSTGTLTLTNCAVSQNFGGQDGALVNTGTATATNCSFTNNAANQFGGLANPGTMTLTNCTISGNGTEQGGAGGFINNGTLTMIDCTLSGNLTVSVPDAGGGNGGGLANYGKADLTNCTLNGNGCIINSNGATAGFGGGIQNAASATLNLLDCTLSANVAGTGGGLNNLGSATLTNTIVAGNKNTPGAPSDIAVTKNVSGSYNLIGTGGSGGLTNGVNGNIVDVSNPGVGSLGSYGGPTQTMALLPGSPAIGKATATSAVTTDQRGMPRGAVVDIGAFQYSLAVESPAGAVNTDPAQLTLTGAVSLANSFAGPVGISFDPAVFTGKQTINLAGAKTPIELDTHVPNWTITTQGLTPSSSITVGGAAQVFQVDKNATANISGLTIETSSSSSTGLGLLSNGITNLTSCQFIGPSVKAGFNAIDVEGGALNISESQITGWNTGIVVNNATAAITHSTITGTGTGIYAAGAQTSVTAHYDDLESNTLAGINNRGAHPAIATYDWWGSSSGPNSSGASQSSPNVEFSPWLGDKQSLNLATPDSLGFTSTAANSYTVTPDLNGPVLQISLAGDSNAPWSVTPTGTIVFSGKGGVVTINGQPKTDAFTITNAAVTFTAGDVFSGAEVQFIGSVGRVINAKGNRNSFDVSGWTGTGTVAAPIAGGTVSSIVATKSAGYTLTNTSLRSTDGMNLTLTGITSANLTANTSSGNPTDIVDASAFRERRT